MTKENAYREYLNNVSAFEKYDSSNIISFEDWLDIKGIEIDYVENEYKWLSLIKDNIINRIEEKELKFYKELLYHTSQDIDTLDANHIKVKFN